MNSSNNKKIFISCAPGLESVLVQECQMLGINLPSANQQTASSSPISGEEKGGLEFEGTDSQIYLCNLHLRTASRVIVRLGEFYAAAFSELRKKASRLPWEIYLKPGQPVEIKVTCHKSKLYHSDAVVERVKGAIEDHFHTPSASVAKGQTAQLILVRLANDLCTISIDSSGELLHRRGYRQAVAKAPLRETLAAGLLYSAGWNGQTPLVDPFCGSGTIPVEAALIARKIAPGINRPFAFMSWPVYQKTIFEQQIDQARKEIQDTGLLLYGSDRDRGAIEMAAANAARTGVNHNIQFACHAISDLPHFDSPPGFVITNPPYGIRVTSSKDLRNLYASFGKLLHTNFSGWQAGILCSEDALIAALELGSPQKSIHLVNGGIPVKFTIFSIV